MHGNLVWIEAGQLLQCLLALFFVYSICKAYNWFFCGRFMSAICAVFSLVVSICDWVYMDSCDALTDDDDDGSGLPGWTLGFVNTLQALAWAGSYYLFTVASGPPIK